MSKNKKVIKKAVSSTVAKAPVKLTKKSVTLIVISAVLAAVILTLCIIGIASAVQGNRRFDYLKDDLSKYIYLSREDYANYEVVNKVIPVNDLAIRNEIIKILAQNRSEAPRDNGSYRRDTAISVGDDVFIYYRGYTVDENGKEINILGENNFMDSTYKTVTIGSSDMPLGFELGLIGIVPKEHEFFTKRSSGTVAEGEVVYIDYKVLRENATTSYSGARIELGAEADEIYGEGFTDFIVGRKIGEKISDTFSVILDGEMQETVYYEVTVNFATKCESNPIVVEAYLPNDFSDEAYRAKKVYYDVYIEKTIVYDAPEFNDEFLTDTLKVKEEDVADYEGATLAEKYKGYIEAQLKEDYDKAMTSCIESQMWVHYKDKVTVKSLPESEIKKFYDSYYTEVKLEYEYYKDAYQTIDEFARAYLELGSNDNWREYLRDFAKDVVKQKLIFYYVIRAEGLVPTAEEYDRIYNEVLNECVEAYLKDIDFDRDDYKTDDEYNAALAENIRIVKDYYGEAYLKESVYYKYAIDELTGFATVK